MEATRKLEAAHRLHPQNALVHYSYACGLDLAMQHKSAEEVMKTCARSHPEFLLAQFAMQGPIRWRSPFTLPPWGQETRTVHPAISQAVMGSVLLSVRDGILPRATLFHRDSGGDLGDLRTLGTARITLATVISPVRKPQVIAIYAKVYDNPSNPLEIEVLEVPFRPRGHRTRCAYERFCTQDDVDFIVIGRGDEMLCNKRLQFSGRMKEVNHRLLEMLSSTEGRDVTDNELMRALVNHQQQFSPSSVRDY